MKKQAAAILMILMLICWGVTAIAGEIKPVLDEIDAYNDAKNYNGALMKAKQAAEDFPEAPCVMWRVARAYFNVADQKPDDLQIQKDNMYPGLEYAKKCLALNDSIAEGHQYYSILIGRVGEIEGTKQKIENSYEVKDHTLRAIELDPTNDGNYHVMGRWNYALADLSWAERKIASIIYATPPAASFEEAVKYFKKAHELAPDDVRHLLWMGKSLANLDKKDEAKKVYQQGLAIKAESESDKSMQKEIKELLEDL